MSEQKLDLAILVSDSNMRGAMQGILSRTPALSIRPISFRIFVHPERDPGCLLNGHNFLKPMISNFSRAIVMFDREGCGREQQAREPIETDVSRRLAESGWDNRAKAIVLDPELEIWVWSDSPEVDRCLGWQHRTPSLRNWLNEQGIWAHGAPKPLDPKKAMELALRAAKKPRSSSIYRKIAETVSLRRCADPSFKRLTEILQQWFPPLN
ncbi:MAG: hypothetical protein WAW37_02480 [Syntrophobacteraceae bacterium]